MKAKIFRVQIASYLLMFKRVPGLYRLGWQRVIEHPLPDDAEVVRVGYDETGWLLLMVQSEEYEDVTEGNTYPDVVTPMFRLEYADVADKSDSRGDAFERDLKAD